MASWPYYGKYGKSVGVKIEKRKILAKQNNFGTKIFIML